MDLAILVSSAGFLNWGSLHWEGQLLWSCKSRGRNDSHTAERGAVRKRRCLDSWWLSSFFWGLTLLVFLGCYARPTYTWDLIWYKLIWVDFVETNMGVDWGEKSDNPLKASPWELGKGEKGKWAGGRTAAIMSPQKHFLRKASLPNPNWECPSQPYVQDWP